MPSHHNRPRIRLAPVEAIAACGKGYENAGESRCLGDDAAPCFQRVNDSFELPAVRSLRTRFNPSHS
jgi:hypothetical protein